MEKPFPPASLKMRGAHPAMLRMVLSIKELRPGSAQAYNLTVENPRFQRDRGIGKLSPPRIVFEQSIVSKCWNFFFDRNEFFFFPSSSLIIKFQSIILQLPKNFRANIHDSLKRVLSRELVRRLVAHKHTFWTKSRFHFS